MYRPLGSWILEVGARPPQLDCTSSLESVPCPFTDSQHWLNITVFNGPLTMKFNGKASDLTCITCVESATFTYFILLQFCNISITICFFCIYVFVPIGVYATDVQVAMEARRGCGTDALELVLLVT
ncbi:hypothetical protein STEG23_023888, partial [Scotinomys teguina]